MYIKVFDPFPRHFSRHRYPRFVMDSYFKFTKSPAVEGTKFFAWNMFISGGRGSHGDTWYPAW